MWYVSSLKGIFHPDQVGSLDPPDRTPGFLQLSAGADAIVQKIMSLPFTKVRACRSWHHRNFAMVEIYRWKIVHFFRDFMGIKVMSWNIIYAKNKFFFGTFPLRWWRYVVWKPDFDAVFKEMRVKNQSTTWMLGCSVGSAGKGLGSVVQPQSTPFTSRWNNPLILTSDPYFQRDILGCGVSSLKFEYVHKKDV